jgi:hypothetical protein
VSDRHDDLPPGFARDGPTGLIIPAGSRALELETWDHAEGKILARAQDVALRRGILFSLLCADPRCAEQRAIEQILLPDGSFAWRCQHKNRIVRKFK